MEKVKKNVDNSVMNSKDAAAARNSARRARARQTAPKAPLMAENGAQPEYPDKVDVVISQLTLIEYADKDDEGNVVVDTETGEVIIHRKCILTFDQPIDGIVASGEATARQFAIGKRTTLDYTAYYLMRVAALSSKRLRMFLSTVAQRYGKKSFSEAAMIGLLEDARVTIKRTYHPAGSTYVDKAGAVHKYEHGKFDKDILNIEFSEDGLELFKEQVLMDIKFDQLKSAE